MNQPTSLYLAS
ncbi:hypothetical protein D043_4829A, partial [Vibrio parahaemolyticus EKP-021]